MIDRRTHQLFKNLGNTQEADLGMFIYFHQEVEVRGGKSSAGEFSHKERTSLKCLSFGNKINVIILKRRVSNSIDSSAEEMLQSGISLDLGTTPPETVTPRTWFDHATHRNRKSISIMTADHHAQHHCISVRNIPSTI